MGKYFTYTFYEKNLQPGELWIRDTNGSVLKGSEALASVYAKYKITDPVEPPDYDTLDFYNNLISGTKILRFDIMQDVIFLETQRGCIFDQITLENGVIKPSSLDNNFLTSAKTSRLGFPDYWFDEINRKIYIVSNKVFDYSSALRGIEIQYMMEVYDLNFGILDLKYLFNIHFDFGIQNYYTEFPIIEPPKISYNKDTKMFNVSHLMRGPKKQFGLVSLNILKDQNLNVRQINGFFPFKSTENVNYKFSIQKTLTVDSDYQ